ncbi:MULTISPECIES: polysaccharide biosynthesis/export family protein [Mesorhizobium]|uniref:Polysaccharide export protein n=1 Tax=Mesorhizobium opportunistum (strain LMG 24607 / HAMBI 3007 / WSM2075) TaxID=536019 RepID=F7Y6U4_MESOW|nr:MULTISPECIES: polysaccharide biosynthesis/export family protein [Mesorhizobium]AEH87414.1 polysaccharide export protein [Mesorhizobium opportunistum WSM2075]MCA0030289.1 polysaccharide biosynthesis/export family protein [Mesorhizobium sp. B263B2A]TPN50162.1 sugar ABC transporter substrate-binding protein [Mesorhizobium sp. B1-1-9]TPN53288.1 sugar ABC transporter substrate-binding protein [Mesorhizobium sp. B1-1-7]
MLEEPTRSIDIGLTNRVACSRKLFNRWRTAHFLRVAVLAGLSASAVVGASSANPTGYVLGAQDKIRVKVYEWRASRDSIFAWDALNDVYTVGPDGSVSLPLVGEIKAAGFTTQEVAGFVGESLMRSIGLARPPAAAVEIVQFRPIYVVGKVSQSGEFAYRPGLTVLKALGLAGGLRTREDKDARFEREAIQARGDLGLIRLNEVNLLVRKARLEAELSHADEIALPPEVTAHIQDSAIAMIVKQERLVFQARSEGLDTQIKALQNLREFLEKELTSLEEQLVFLDTQIKSIQKELKSVSALVDKGLAVAPREFSLERTLAQAQSERLAAETSLLRGRQEISKTDISILELQDGRRNEVTVDLRQTQAELDALASKTETTQQLLYDSEVSAPSLEARRADTEAAAPIYTIFRPSADGTTEKLEASETSAVEPGDTIKVDIPMISDDLGAFGATSKGRKQAPGIALREDPTNTIAIP